MCSLTGRCPGPSRTLIWSLGFSCRCRVGVYPDASHHVSYNWLLLHLWPVHSARPGLWHPPVALATVNRVRSLLCLLPAVLVCGPHPFTSCLRSTRATQGKPMLDQAGQLCLSWAPPSQSQGFPGRRSYQHKGTLHEGAGVWGHSGTAYGRRRGKLRWTGWGQAVESTESQEETETTSDGVCGAESSDRACL